MLPLCMKLTLVLAALSAQGATYLLYTTPCFVDIEVTTNLEQVLRVDVDVEGTRALREERGFDAHLVGAAFSAAR